MIREAGNDDSGHMEDDKKDTRIQEPGVDDPGLVESCMDNLKDVGVG